MDVDTDAQHARKDGFSSTWIICLREKSFIHTVLNTRKLKRVLVRERDIDLYQFPA